MNQIPNGPKDMVCPLHRQPMVKVCRRCPLWINLRGNNYSEWKCSLTWLPTLLIEVGREMSKATVTIDAFRDEATKTETARNNMLAHMINIKQPKVSE